jgi:uncharacterized OB-fold protein
MGVPNHAPRFDTEHNRPFYEGLERGELRLTACSECGTIHWYPPEALPCHPDAKIEWRVVSPNGRIYMFSVIHRSLLPGDHAAETPYTSALVESDDAPGARIPALIVNLGSRPPTCDMRVRLSPVRAGDHMIAAFEPID